MSDSYLLFRYQAIERNTPLSEEEKQRIIQYFEQRNTEILCMRLNALRQAERVKNLNYFEISEIQCLVRVIISRENEASPKPDKCCIVC